MVGLVLTGRGKVLVLVIILKEGKTVEWEGKGEGRDVVLFLQEGGKFLF